MTMRTDKTNLPTILVLLTLAIQIALLAGVLWRVNEIYSAMIGNSVVPADDISIVNDVSEDDDPSLGPSSAPVTIVVFSDYACGHCRALESTLTAIQSQMGDQVRIVARDFPLQGRGSGSFLAAEAAECADEQGGFWPMRARLFAAQPAFDRTSLLALAMELNLDSPTFERCLTDQQVEKEVQRDRDDGVSYGVSSTPTMFVNGRRVVGAVDVSTLRRISEAVKEGAKRR